MDSHTSTTKDDLERMLYDDTAVPKALPLSLLAEITNGFSAEHQIGEGGFAVIYQGILKNGKVAVKRLSNKLMDDKEFLREVECLMTVKHKNVVRFLGYCADTQGSMELYNGKLVMANVTQRLLCFEYLSKGSLDQYITDASCGLEWRNRYKIIKGISHGLDYLHQKYILHLDLKPANILLDDDWVPKIADFGLSRFFHENQSRAITANIGGTLGYLPPEFCNGEITYLFDRFSLGVIFMELLTGKKGYHDVDNVVESWSNRLEESWGDIQLEQVRVCAEIGIECTDSNPAKRPDSTQHIIDRLDETGSVDGYIEAGMITSHQAENSSNKLHQDRPKDLGETSPQLGSSRSRGLGSVVEHFTLDTLRSATEGFDDQRRIGSGSFGSVYRGTLPDGREVAIKRAEEHATKSSSSARPARRRDRETAFNSELTALARANHKNIVCLLGCCAQSGERVLVYEFMINGTLHDQLHDRSPMAPSVMSWRGRLSIALGAARGIEYMHVYAVPPIIHRDIKSANILLDDSWTAKIADFGLSSVLEPAGDCEDNNGDNPQQQPQKTIYTGGTVGYMDPEYYRLQHLTDKSDVYSFGVVLLELMSGCRVVQRYAESVTPKNVVEFTVPHILADDVARVLDPRLPTPTPDESEALAYVGYLAADCVGPVGFDRPSMTEVVDALERALAATSTAPVSRSVTARRVLSRSGTL